jgi:hypothetical protein
MNPEEIDRILSRQSDLTPSSGFTESVMDAVRREAATPAPIPFPWKWAAAGIAAIATVLILLGFECIQEMRGAPQGVRIPSVLNSQLQTAMRIGVDYGVGWVLMALVISIVAMKLTRRLVS